MEAATGELFSNGESAPEIAKHSTAGRASTIGSACLVERLRGDFGFIRVFKEGRRLLDWAEVGLHGHGEHFGIWNAVRIGYYSNPVGFMMALVTMALTAYGWTT